MYTQLVHFSKYLSGALSSICCVCVLYIHSRMLHLHSITCAKYTIYIYYIHHIHIYAHMCVHIYIYTHAHVSPDHELKIHHPICPGSFFGPSGRCFPKNMQLCMGLGWRVLCWRP